MKNILPFQIKNFSEYYFDLHRVGINPGYVMYTNRHASNDQPAARLVPAEHLNAARTHVIAPTPETGIQLVRLGVLLDTEWDIQTQRWDIISFHGWETLHKAFSHLHAKAEKSLIELTGVSASEYTEVI